MDSSEDWRMECEARHVLGLAGLEVRRNYLGLVEMRRGQEARRQLEAAMMVEWNKRNQAKGKR